MVSNKLKLKSNNQSPIFNYGKNTLPMISDVIKTYLLSTEMFLYIPVMYYMYFNKSFFNLKKKLFKKTLNTLRPFTM